MYFHPWGKYKVTSLSNISVLATEVEYIPELQYKKGNKKHHTYIKLTRSSYVTVAKSSKAYLLTYILLYASTPWLGTQNFLATSI